MFDLRFYLNIAGKIVRVKCRVLGDILCIRRMLFYDFNVINF